MRVRKALRPQRSRKGLCWEHEGKIKAFETENAASPVAFGVLSKRLLTNLTQPQRVSVLWASWRPYDA